MSTWYVLGTGWLLWAGALAWWDLKFRRLPNWLTLPAIGVVLLVATLADRVLPAVAGGCAWWALNLLVAVARPGHMGGGDVKLAASLGAVSAAAGGPVAWFVAVIGAGVATGTMGLLWGIGRPSAPPVAVPHGPGMRAATAVAVGVGLLVAT